jgi:hypothetical protein
MSNKQPSISNTKQKGHKRINSNSNSSMMGNTIGNMTASEITINNHTNYNLNMNTVNPSNIGKNNDSQLGIVANTQLLVSDKSDDVKSLQQKVDCVGKVPTARFGHTIILVSPVKVVLFGGAVGDTKNFQFTGDTYVLNLMTKIWLKLESIYR